ncbi:MAG: hypothetical protein COW88_03020 [Candidatus Lloydbacteria bacterium CG22_combo_CG10-13_8_21_14_all_47_15]|uniref:N-acetyltransferase domain-containing protein n=1 Tax=Candidatus Lloydbacteria bacterium CG22_combo_CG10-13_8_21_14_all_47_15 TaxID=1974635 RepID=A0A2H0CUK7_9BACT|nr:MAG: hypothetical protein COW88_03020 [Candidatus Lloydbacteria bacterium CG22_combo_CG10-13_8_21_14_all_47_15]
MKARKYNKKDEIEVKNIFSKYWTDNEFLDELAEELDSDNCRFYVAEDDNEIVGVAGLREAPTHLRNHADTKKPAELYIIASKYKNKGTGNLLGQKIIEGSKKLKFTEIVCYSPETHDSSWRFYEKLGFTKHGIINDPDDGYPGMLWKKTL